ncbi:MAG: dockerin type I repeat-containing protein, partial [Clostridia bacterium]|nr:dockerin type I repeat-containing protein [Clostridia bacterium]
VDNVGSAIFSPEHPIHISGVCLDDCAALEYAKLEYADRCTEFSALNCPSLSTLIVRNSALEHIAFSPSAFGKDFYIRAFGAGSVGVRYRNYNDAPDCTLYAYPAEDFLGWYSDGALISTERTCEVFDGGNYVACYGGDADGSGSITVTDAIIVLREAMGLGRDGEISEQMMDVNGSGTVDVSDAIMILRFAMGII